MVPLRMQRYKHKGNFFQLRHEQLRHDSIEENYQIKGDKMALYHEQLIHVACNSIQMNSKCGKDHDHITSCMEDFMVALLTVEAKMVRRC